MDTDRFDRLTMSLGKKLSRRRALALGAAGLATAGLSRVSAAQEAAPAA